MQTADLGGSIATTAGNFTGTSTFGANATYATTSTINYCIDGKAYTKTAVTGGTTPTTDYITSAAITLTANYGTVVVWCLDSGGTVRVVKGETVSLTTDGSFSKAPNFPTLPDSLVPFAYHLIRAGSTTSGTWTFGTSNWNATGLTHAARDILYLPSRPQTAA